MKKYDQIIHLIKIAALTNETIICVDIESVNRIKAIAKSINIIIKIPKTFKEIICKN